MEKKQEKRFLILACEILSRECALCAAKSPRIVDVHFLEKGLHDIGQEKMNARLQAELGAVDPQRYEAVLMGYGLCNNGVQGLRCPVPMVFPRAHDCITLLMGSRQRYDAYFRSHPGTFYYSPGWVERDTDIARSQGTLLDSLGLNKTYAQYVELYGRENADFIVEKLGGWEKSYSRIAFIDTGLGPREAYLDASGQEAQQHGWALEELPGDLSLLQRLADGQWDPSDFLIVPPGQTLTPSYDQGVIRLG
ncbi:MAG: DUF1638 domain-containing protein [Eubacteriales bacterium]|nr:DUF1638 domain-containing protein [Eubacteriales bacterium]